MNEGCSAIPPVGIGEVMRAGGVGRVASRNAAFGVGDDVYRAWGREVAHPDDDQALGSCQIDLRLGHGNAMAQRARMPGMTAYFGLFDDGPAQRRRDGPRVRAAGRADGRAAGEDRGLPPCRRHRGRPGQVRGVVKELGSDACIDYKAGSVRATA